MQVAKWGNSLAVRLPASLVRELGLKEGDEVELRPAGPAVLEVERDSTREQALKELRSLARPLPPGYKFDREALWEERYDDPDAPES